MTQEERRRYLIETLLQEDERYAGIQIPESEDEQKRLYRSLVNVRPPMPATEDFLKVQDAYLQQELSMQTIVDAKDLKPVQDHLVLWQGDITLLKADAIVNAANSALLGCFVPCHGCIDNIIHTRSGVQLRSACYEIMKKQGHEEPTGQAKITPAFNLPSRMVIHTVGPIITSKLTGRDEKDLASCYRSCLDLAVENHCRSIAFCCISTGEFHFPQQRAAEIAVSTVKEFLLQRQSDIKVIFNVFKDEDRRIYQKILEAV